MRSTTQLVYVDGPSLSVVTDRLDYKKGEPIAIRVVNSGTVPLEVSEPLRITGLSGILMYSEAAPDGLRLKPMQEAEFSWDQVKNDGDEALEGLYKISASGVDRDGGTVARSTTVTIWK